MVSKEVFQGKWNQIKGKIKERWGKLTDDEIVQINGRRELLIGKLQEKYGWAKDKVEQQLRDFEESLELDTAFTSNRPGTSTRTNPAGRGNAPGRERSGGSSAREMDEEYTGTTRENPRRDRDEDFPRRNRNY